MVDRSVLPSPTTHIRLYITPYTIFLTASALRPFISITWTACTSLPAQCSLAALLSTTPLHTHKCIQKRSSVMRFRRVSNQRALHLLPEHTSLEGCTAVLCAGRWIPPTCDLRERADVLFSSCSVRAEYQIERHEV